jgi:hypothetical protein
MRSYPLNREAKYNVQGKSARVRRLPESRGESASYRRCFQCRAPKVCDSYRVCIRCAEWYAEDVL